MVKLFFVGVGTPTPTPFRFGTCYVLKVSEEYLMFDCGPASTYKLVKMGLWPTRIDHLFFSHHHFDHNADYPCFMLCRWDQSIGKENELRVWGPPPTQWVTERLIGAEGAFRDDWKARIEHPGSQDIHVGRGGGLPRPEPRVLVKDIEEGEVIHGSRWSVVGRRSRHIEPWMPTFAYRIETEKGSLTITSDTGYCSSIVDIARGTDYLLIHCWGFQESMKPAEAGMITGTIDAARLASDAGAKKLILSHAGSSLTLPGCRERAVIEISRVFSGEIFFPEELTELTI